MVTTTTKEYKLLYLGRLDKVAEVPPAPAPADLSEFLQPPPASPEYELLPEVEPIPAPDPLLEYIPLPELGLMSLDLPLLEPIAPEVLVIKISSSDSPA